MPRTKSFLVHVDQVDPAAYDGHWNGHLEGPRADVAALGAEIERLHQGDPDFDVHYFPADGFRPTRKLFFDWLDWFAGELVTPGDLLIFHYSGHGGTIPNSVGGLPARLNTICLFDGMVLDAELASRWAKFRPGVLIVFSADSCHSGTIARFRQQALRRPAGAAHSRLVERAIPREIADASYSRFQNFYDQLEAAHQVAPATSATVLQLAACTDDQSAYEDPDRHPSMGIFSSALAETLRGTHPATSYDELNARVLAIVSARASQLGKEQTPVVLQLGAAMTGLMSARAPFEVA